MFTGIVESLGIVKKITTEGTNKHFVIESSVSNEMKPDESIAHNGVCLTVTKVEDGCHHVTAIEETLIKSNLGEFKEGDPVNLERAMVYNARLDGHMVQGHVDQTATCTKVVEMEGSHYFYFEHDDIPFINVEKGSICVDGVSLTVVDVWKNGFSVAIIPYTLEYTIFGNYKPGSRVNLEYDIIGKYVSRIMEAYVSK